MTKPVTTTAAGWLVHEDEFESVYHGPAKESSPRDTDDRADARRSVGRSSARQIENGTGRERTLFRREPAYERRDLVDGAEAGHRDLRQHEVDVLLRDLIEDRSAHGG